jgi:hypothetical protein
MSYIARAVLKVTVNLCCTPVANTTLLEGTIEPEAVYLRISLFVVMA